MSRDGIDKQFYIGCRMWQLEQVPHLPVPVGPETVSPAVKVSESDPGENRCDHQYQMNQACTLKCPACKDERDDEDVREMEEDVEEMKKHVSIAYCRLQIPNCKFLRLYKPCRTG